MASINSEILEILNAKLDVAESLITTFGVQEADTYNGGTVSTYGLYDVDSSTGDPTTLKRLSLWRSIIETTNVHTTNALTLSASGNGATPGSIFDGSEPKIISYNSIGAASADHDHSVLNNSFIFNDLYVKEDSTNLGSAVSASSLSFYKNGICIPYKSTNPNDGGIIRCRGNVESNTIFELATWDDSGQGETILFNYYGSASNNPTYSVAVPKKTGVITLNPTYSTVFPANGVPADNTVYNLGTISTLSISSVTTSVDETIIYFTAGSGFLMSIPASTKIVGDLKADAGKSYVISILNGIVVMGEITIYN